MKGRKKFFLSFLRGHVIREEIQDCHQESCRHHDNLAPSICAGLGKGDMPLWQDPAHTA
jgi:hypothetical protein